uniref:cyclic AMP-responsive element-binding protein 1-like isoform X3 n=1 Tax=Myxine glutinosa TaxID=7769 RepID=UPI00358DEF3B
MSNETENRENGTVNSQAVTNTQPGQLHLHTTQVSGTPGVSVVQIPGGQTIEVQSVIQTQQSVIQTPTIQTVQVAAMADTEDSEGSVEAVSDTKKRREILSRRPSYRKIFNELSSDPPSVSRIDEEKSEEEGSGQAISTATLPSIYQTSTGQYIAIAQGGAVQLSSASAGDNVLGLQGLSVGGGQTGTPTLVHYTQTSDGQQLLLPANQVVVQVHFFSSCLWGSSDVPDPYNIWGHATGCRRSNIISDRRGSSGGSIS